MENNSNSNFSPETTVGELRKQYGPHFAEGHQDQDTLGKILALAGASSLDEYLQRKGRSAA